VERLLKEFGEITKEELHVILPHQRSNPHHIDVILGVSLPNQATHYLGPIEKEAVNREVKGLLTGLINV
jgi:hypothetical protein